LDLLQLRYFQIVSEYEHISRAAEKIGIAQPSLSIMISKLEKELGVLLFDRSGRQIKLNDCGKKYLEYVNDAFLALENGAQTIQDIQNKMENTIHIGCTSPLFTLSILKRIIPVLPNVTVKQSIINVNDIPGFLMEKSTSFVISPPGYYGEDILSNIIFEEELLLAMCKTHRLADRINVKLSEVKDEPFIAHSTGLSFRALCEDYCHKAGFHPNNVMECDHATRSELIAQNFGIAISTSLAYANEYPLPHIRFIPISEPHCVRKMALFKRKDKYYSKSAKEFETNVIKTAQYLTDLASVAYSKCVTEQSRK